MWQIKRANKNVHIIDCDPKKEHHVLLISDAHWDNAQCNLKLLQADLEEAVKRNAAILSFGDHFCLMQGKWDKRSKKDDLRPEFQTDTYLDTILEEAREWHEPYAPWIALMGYGNHETAIIKHHETDITKRFTRMLFNTGGTTLLGGYNGHVRWSFGRGQKYTAFYSHGFGGGGPVTKGAIDYNRLAEWNDGMDAIICGHVHWKSCVPVAKNVLGTDNVVRKKILHYVRTGTYQESYGKGERGFHVERGQGPRPLGGYWLRLKLVNGVINCSFEEAGEK